MRSLEREIASICRKVARQVVEDAKGKDAADRDRRQERPQVPRRARSTALGKKEEHDEIGLTNGLAVTQYGGGDLLACEVAVVPGKGKLVITGLLEKGMEESAQAAMSYVRSRAAIARARAGLLPEGRRARSLPGVHPQGRPERRRHDGDVARERAHQGARCGATSR